MLGLSISLWKSYPLTQITHFKLAAVQSIYFPFGFVNNIRPTADFQIVSVLSESPETMNSIFWINMSVREIEWHNRIASKRRNQYGNCYPLMESRVTQHWPGVGGYCGWPRALILARFREISSVILNDVIRATHYKIVDSLRNFDRNKN